MESKTVLAILSVLAIAGTTQMIYGGMWDAVSHILKAPEYFWSVQHVVVYAGVAMTASSAMLGSFAILSGKYHDKTLRRGITLIVIGAILQIASGYADSISHDIFGIDGLVSWSHQPLELGLLLSSIGAYLVLGSSEMPRLRRLLPVSIMTMLFSAMWLGFNLLLLAGAPVLCLPVYQIFSSGCAVL